MVVYVNIPLLLTLVLVVEHSHALSGGIESFMLQKWRVFKAILPHFL